MQRVHERAKRLGIVAVALLLLMPAARSRAQSVPHLVLVTMVDKPNGQFAFEPAAISAQHGDTVRFLQSSTAPHNVHFEKMPKGARLGAAASGPYLIGRGKAYDLVIDTRFVDGAYEFVCDPHEGVGMRGTLSVGTSEK
jgi:plastocyanin